MPEKPILVYPSLAAQIGLEGATLLSVLCDLTTYLNKQPSQGYDWYYLPAVTLNAHLPFWDSLDIQRLSQQLRDQGIILLRSSPYSQSQALDFALTQNQLANNTNKKTTINTHQAPQGTSRNLTGHAQLIAANWQPDQETLTALLQINIPEHFAREHVPEFVRYWRESGETQRAWGSKFIQYVKRQWTYQLQRSLRQQQATSLTAEWQPSQEVLSQIAHEGIPATFAQKVLTKFRLYHQKSGSRYASWDMPFFSWVKEAWQKQDTPFIENKAHAMYSEWQPDKHTSQYLQTSYGVDEQFIQESIPEFVHKWIEKKAIYAEWGKVFAEHVIEQWRFVQAGIQRNPQRQPIHKNWKPSADCIEILIQQLSITQPFIEQTLPEFILYWQNRAEPMHSWDNIFLRYIKNEWAKQNQGEQNERQQRDSESTRTKDRSIQQQLSDTSWAS